jgi:hypothetical protein
MDKKITKRSYVVAIRHLQNEIQNGCLSPEVLSRCLIVLSILCVKFNKLKGEV